MDNGVKTFLELLMKTQTEITSHIFIFSGIILNIISGSVDNQP